MKTRSEKPSVTFYQMFPNAPVPARASPNLFGWLPTNANYCKPVTAASAFGWYLFPPTDFSLKWDGTSVFWKLRRERKWRLLSQVMFSGKAMFPDYEKTFQKNVPFEDEHLRPLSFLQARNEMPGIVQIWTGIIARTRPGWSLLVRSPANFPRHPQYDVMEGIIETDWWMGEVISVIRLCATDQPIEFETNRPLFQVQPIPKAAHRDSFLHAAKMVEGMENFSLADWKDYAKVQHLRRNPEAKRGSYKTEVHRREQKGKNKTTKK